MRGPEGGRGGGGEERLRRKGDAMRDSAELQEEEERGSFKYVPGLVKPWTVDLTMVAGD